MAKAIATALQHLVSEQCKIVKEVLQAVGYIELATYSGGKKRGRLRFSASIECEAQYITGLPKYILW